VKVQTYETFDSWPRMPLLGSQRAAFWSITALTIGATHCHGSAMQRI
jgi:hypothetical protein